MLNINTQTQNKNMPAMNLKNHASQKITYLNDNIAIDSFSKTSAPKNIQSPSFKGLPAGAAKILVNGKEEVLKIYKVEAQDLPFLKQMLRRIDMKKLVPEKAGEKNFNQWYEMIEAAVDYSVNNNSKALLGVFNKKPCAIASYDINRNNHFDLEFLASFPTEPGQHIQNAGKGLVRQILGEYQKTNADKLILYPNTRPPKTFFNIVYRPHKLKDAQVHGLNDPNIASEFSHTVTLLAAPNRLQAKFSSNNLRGHFQKMGFENSSDPSLINWMVMDREGAAKSSLLLDNILGYQPTLQKICKKL